MNQSITKKLLNSAPCKTSCDVEQALSVELDALLTSAAASLAETPDLSSPESERRAECVYPSLVNSQKGWAESCAKSISSQLKCEVWFIEFNRNGTRKRLVGSQLPGESARMDQVYAIAQDAYRSLGPIGSLGLQVGEVASPIIDSVVRDRRIDSAWSLSIELPTLGGRLAIVCLWNEPPTEKGRELLRSISLGNNQELVRSYETWRFMEQGEKSWRRKEMFFLWSHQRLPASLVAIAGLIGILAIPCPYRPKRDCVLESAARHYVASPMEGKLVKTMVRPGEEVRVGETLAQLEDIQLKREIATAEAELKGASKKRDIARANAAWGDLRLASLECQQMELKLETLRERLGQLEIQSPADGVVVQGDWFGNDGMPVTFGQSLFEIASLQTMLVEVHLKPEDLPWIDIGTKGILRTESTGSRSWVGRIQRIEPRAEIINDKAVLVAEMEVENPDWMFRPGMKGDVVVNTGNHSIGWILFHKPLRWLRNQWVW